MTHKREYGCPFVSGGHGDDAVRFNVIVFRLIGFESVAMWLLRMSCETIGTVIDEE